MLKIPKVGIKTHIVSCRISLLGINTTPMCKNCLSFSVKFLGRGGWVRQGCHVS